MIPIDHKVKVFFHYKLSLLYVTNSKKDTFDDYRLVSGYSFLHIATWNICEMYLYLQITRLYAFIQMLHLIAFFVAVQIGYKKTNN